MAARINSYAEDLTLSQKTSASYSDKVSLAFSAEASTDYWVIWSALLQANGGGSSAKAKLLETATDLCLTEEFAYDSTDWIAACGLAKLNPGGSPATLTPKIQWAADGTNNCGIKQAALCVLKSAAADKYAESLVESTTTSNSYGDKTTLTFTPASTGDYLILASAEINQSSTASNFAVAAKLLVDSTSYGEMNGFSENNAGHYYPWMHVVKVNLSNASHTLKIQFSTGTFANGTAKIRNARILAIRLDTLNNNYYAESRSRTTTTSTSYQDKTTLTQTPAASDHLILACGVSDGDTDGTSQFAQLIEDAASIAETKQASLQANFSFSKRNFFALYKKTLAASSKTWKTQYKSAGSQTTGFAESAIAVLQLGDVAASGIGSLANGGLARSGLSGRLIS